MAYSGGLQFGDQASRLFAEPINLLTIVLDLSVRFGHGGNAFAECGRDFLHFRFRFERIDQPTLYSALILFGRRGLPAPLRPPQPRLPIFCHLLLSPFRTAALQMISVTVY